jgi:hypothetical protein
MRTKTKRSKNRKQIEVRRQKKLEKKRRQRKGKKYSPERYLSRNQKEVAKRLIDGEVTMISSASWGFVERFLVFLNELGFFELIQVDGARFYRQMIDIGLLIMTYEIKVLLGIASMNQVGERLFKDVALMRLIGYTSDQLLSGFCRRGRAESDKPIHKNTLADAVEKLTPEELSLIFNGAVKRLAEHGFFEHSGGVFALDSTDLPTTEHYAGAGRRTRIVKKKARDKQVVEIEETVHGFKLCALYEMASRLVVAVKISPIQQHDSTFTLELVQQARKNLGNDMLDIVIADRGFLDGEDLWTLKSKWGIDFIVPAKSNMRVTADVRAFAKTPADGDSVFVAKREGDDRQQGEVQLRGIRSLLSYDQYGDVEHQKQIDTRRFEANPINALLIQSWNGRVPKTGDETVFLTSLPVIDPLWVLDTYGLRSLIENCLFRELKQGWNLLSFPKKTQDAVRGHVYLTLLVFNLSNAYRTHTGQDLTAQGIRRQRLDWYEANQVFVFAGEFYAIFDLEELLIFLDREPEICWRVDPDRVRREYGLIDQKRAA